MKVLEHKPTSLSQKYEVVEKIRDRSLWGNGLQCLFRGEKCYISDSPYNAFQIKSCKRYETVSQMMTSPLYNICINRLGCDEKTVFYEDDTISFKAICSFDAFFYIFLDNCLTKE